MSFNRLAVRLLTVFALFFPAASWAALSSITPITWDVIGLDSNRPADGPQDFPVGAKVCTSAAVGPVTVSFNWTGTNANINLLGSPTITYPAFSGCEYVYFFVRVDKVTAAYFSSRSYTISASANGTTLTTPGNRRLYAEKLVSQNRNAINGISFAPVGGTLTTVPSGGTMNLVEGTSYTIRLDASTATNGYEQLEAFLTLPHDLYRVSRTSTTYTANSSLGGRISSPYDLLYGDACLWNPVVGSPTYLSCTSTGKVGGVISVTYTLTVLPGAAAAGAQSLQALIYDFSGSSYHYNSDFGSFKVNVNIAPPPPDMAISLTGLPTTATVGVPYSGTYTCSNIGAGAATAGTTCALTGLPAGLSVSGCSISPPTPGNTWVAGNPVPAGSVVTCNVSGTPTATGSATLNGTTGATGDTDPSNNTASLTLTVAAPDMQVSLSGLLGPFTVGTPYSGTFTCTNVGTASATAGTTCAVTGLPAGVSTGACTINSPSANTPWSPGATVPVGAIVTCPVSGTPTSPLPASVTINGSTGATGDTNLPNNSASVTLAVTAPDMSVSVTGLSGPYVVGTPFTGSFTCTNIGTASATAGTTCSVSGLPAGLSVGSCTISPSGSAWVPGNSVPINAVVTCPVTGTPTTAGSGTVTGATGATGDTNTANNSATLNYTVAPGPEPDMAISLAGLPTSATVGTPYSGTFTCTNVGSATASGGTTCSVTGLPAGVTAGSCTINSPTAGTPWSAGAAVPAGAVVSCPVSGTPTTPGSVTINGTTGATGDNNSNNNTATLQLPVSAPDMAISLSGLPASAAVGTPYSGTFTCTNVGNASATAGTTCAVTGLPAGVSTTGCTISPSGSAWVAGNTVAVNAVVTCSVSGTPTTAGTVTVNGSTGATGDTVVPNNTATLSLPVTSTAGPDMAISLAGLPTSASVGTPYSGTFTCTNVGTATAPANAGTTCSVTGLPAGVSTTGCTISPSGATWTAGNSVPAGAVVTCSVSGTPTTAGTATINGSTGANADTNPANNTASLSLPVAAPNTQANLSVVKTALGAIAPGGALSYTIVVSNAGPAAANGATLTDASVANFTATAVSCGSTLGGAVCPASPTVAQLQSGLAIATLPSGGSLTFTLSGTAGASGSIANTASIVPPAGITDPTPGNNTSTANTTITPNPPTTADLSLVKTGPASIAAGGTVTYTIVVSNAGPAAANGATVTDGSVANFTPTTVTCGSATGGAVCPSSPTVAQLQAGIAIATFPSGGSITFTLAGTAGASGSIANTASVFPPTGITDPSFGNNSSLVTTSITTAPANADLSVVKTGPASVTANGVVTYSIVVSNAGPGAANGTVLTDAAVANFSAATVSCGSTIGGAVCPSSPTIAQLEAGIAIPTLPSGGSVTFTLAGSAGSSSAIANTASVTPPTGVTDPSPGNNSSTSNTTVTPAQPAVADLSVNKVGPGLVTSGAAITYQITIRNAGPAAANRAIIQDEAVPNFTALSVICGSTQGGAVCPSSPTVAQLQAGLGIPLLPANASLVLTVNGTATSIPAAALTQGLAAAVTNSIVNIASVVPPAGVTDPFPSDNISTVITQLEGGPAGGTISGFVWYDTNGNRVKDPGEGVRSGWRVQLLNDDFQIIGSTTSGPDGSYSFEGLPPGGYSVRFTPAGDLPGSGAVNGDPSGNGGTPSGTVLSGITVASGSNVVNQSMPLDPSGVVYDSITRDPVAGAQVTLLYNGAPADPQYIAGGSNTDRSASGGQYAFFLLPGAPAGTWGLRVSPSTGYGGSPSTLLRPSTAPDGYQGGSVGTVGPPASGAVTTYYLSFPLPTVDIINNNIPVDPTNQSIPTVSPALLALLALLLAGFARLGFHRRRALPEGPSA